MSLDDRLAVDWEPILDACAEMTGWAGAPDATALGGVLGRLLDAIPDEVLERHLTGRTKEDR